MFLHMSPQGLLRIPVPMRLWVVSARFWSHPSIALFLGLRVKRPSLNLLTYTIISSHPLLSPSFVPPPSPRQRRRSWEVWLG